jgi:hypothetical protein
MANNAQRPREGERFEGARKTADERGAHFVASCCEKV